MRLEKGFAGIVLAVIWVSHALATEPNNAGYEVWAADQSNSVAGVASRGVTGSFMWIWDSEDIEVQLGGGPDAPPVGCSPDPSVPGPCDVLDVFPGTLVEHDADGPTGQTLADVGPFGRLHGMIPDPSGALREHEPVCARRRICRDRGR